MHLTAWNIFRYELPLTAPLPMMGRELTIRSGLLLQVQDGGGRVGIGEVAPFPGLHKESLAAAREQLIEATRTLLHHRFPDAPEPLWWTLKGLPEYDRWFPTVRYGLEVALVNLLAVRRSLSPAGLLFPRHREEIPVNALLVDNGEWEAHLQALLAEGYTTIKLKVGRKSPAEEGERVRAISRRLPPGVRLRLDANRAWTPEEAVEFGQAVRGCPVEYIEEPLRDAAEIPQFYQATGLPCALDESLPDHNPEGFVPPSGVTALVLKPSVIGGVAATLTWAALARKHHLKVVISSPVESGVGLAMAAQLAAGLHEEGVAAGLDTWRYLQEDLIRPRFSVSRGVVQISSLLPTPDLNHTVLTGER